MRRMLLTAILMASMCTMEAQKAFVQYGFLGGVQFVNLYGNPYIESFLQRDLRPVGGPAVYYPLSRHWAIRSNLFYDSRGAQGIFPLFEEDGTSKGFYTTQVNMTSLCVPLLLDYHFGGRLRGNITMGIYGTALLSYKATFSKPNGGEEIVQRGTSYFDPLEGGAVLGYGMRYILNRRITLGIENRLEVGFSNIVSRPVLGSLTIYHLTSPILFGIYYTPGYAAGKVSNKEL